jgi:hypothetical protein
MFPLSTFTLQNAASESLASVTFFINCLPSVETLRRFIHTR